jgi:hypothetical protein
LSYRPGPWFCAGMRRFYNANCRKRNTAGGSDVRAVKRKTKGDHQRHQRETGIQRHRAAPVGGKGPR